MVATSSSFQKLGLTSRWAAAVRASESARPDALFHDPWAAALAGKEGADWIEKRAGNVAPMTIRTRYFDDRLIQAVEERNIRQVVILAAGLDTRAFRLNWSGGTCLYELDQAEVQTYKENILREAGARPACEYRTVAADLTRPWNDLLSKAGFDARQPVAWLMEGFLFYLPNESIQRILADMSELAAPGSWLGFDIVNSVTLNSPYTKAWIEMQAQLGAPWLGFMDDPEGQLAGLGWKAELNQPGMPDANYGRWTMPVIPVKAPGLPHNWYVTATKE